MIPLDSLAIAWLLLVAAFSGFADAARPKEQRRAVADPYLVLPPGSRPDENVRPAPRDLGEREFSLRHIYHHGTDRYPKLHRYKDIAKNAQLFVIDDETDSKEPVPNTFPARAMSANIQRMSDRRRTTIDTMLDYAKKHGSAMPLSATGWSVDEIPGPNHTDKATVLSLARMAANAYTEEPWTGDWVDVGQGFNNTDSFGWDGDGLRGHIFADEKNETIVIGLKGTSMAIFDGSGTTGNDKENDNLFGSCCCAQNGPVMWKWVCKCMNSTYTCNHTCLVRNLLEKNHYYWAVKDLYHNVTERYPDAQVWMAGHSLGGVVSTLLGLTFGLPVVTFEAFPDALAASRLGLPTPPGYHIGAHQSRSDLGIHHFGHTADPVFMGSCNGATASCTLGGYAFEGHCHTGKTCIYDTVNDLGWRSSAWSHRIFSVINDVIKKYDTVPECDEDTECTDCALWKFFESNGTETTTSGGSSTTSATRTRTETCKTPGWWGCLDETTTTTGTSTSTSSSSTSTCETPGWFGCKDPTTTTSSTSVASSSPAPCPTVTTTRPRDSSTATSSSSSTCKTPGWFGCNDPTTTPKPSSTSSLPTSTSSSTCKTPGWFGCNDSTTTANPSSTSSSTTCTSKEWFGLICVDPSPTTSSSKPSPTRLPTTRRKCVQRHWWGWCKEWRDVPEEPKGELKI